MQYLSVKNLARYQHYRHRNPPWIKLYRESWTDYTLRRLTPAERLLFIGLSSLGMELGNKIPYDAHYLTSRLGFLVTTAMLVHLILSNLILSNLEEHEGSDALATCKQDASKKATQPTKMIQLTDWLKTVKANMAYAHINVDLEMSKMDLWLDTHPGRKKTRRFILMWLNRIDAPVDNLTPNGVRKPPPPPPKNDPIGRGQWGKTYGDPREHGYE